MFIGMLKSLKFIDDAGAPTQRYYEYLDATRSARVLADGLRDAYEELFRVNTHANELSVEDIRNKLKTLTQGQKSEKVIGLMASTFKALAEQADWSELTPPPSEVPLPPPSSIEPRKAEEVREFRRVAPKAEHLALQYNIQIVLPDSRDPAVFDAIFRSLREHLF